MIERINNRYIVIDYINEDACGHIYRVKNMTNGRVERLKIFNNKFFKENAIKLFAERFIELSTINHPNISKLYEFSSVDTIDRQKMGTNKYFYTYEDFSSKGVDYLSLSREDSHKALIEICRGLQYLHFRNECYTYLNFENITFYKEDGVLKVKFNDLSHILQYKYLAKYNSKEVNQFLSPKLIWAETIDASADLYSLGIVFYYLYYKYDYRSVTLSLEALEENEIHKAINRLTTNIIEDSYADICAFIRDLVKLIRMPYEFSDKAFYERLNFKNRLIGRDKEINRVLMMAEKSLKLESEENCFFVHGRKGVGKSRLLKELSYRFQFLGYNVFRNDGIDSRGNFSFFKEVVWDIAFNEIVDISLIRKYGTEIGTLMPQIAEHWRIQKEISTVDKIGNLRIANRIYKFIEEYVSNKQLILVIDNLNKLDYYDKKVLEYLINTEREIPLFIVASIDVVEDNENVMAIRYSERKASHMSIVNYSYSDTAEFLNACLGKGHEDIKFVSAIMNRTNGNPAMIIKAIENLFQEEKIFVDDYRKWDFSQVTSFKDIDFEEEYDEKIYDVDNFNHLEMKVLEFLSICDIPIIDEIIMETLNLTAEEFENTIKELKRNEVIDSKFSDWGFSYFVDSKALKRDLFIRIAGDVAINYHRRVSNYLESKYQIDEKFLDDRLIYHLEQSGQYEKCASYSLLYAERLKNFSLKEAQSLMYYNKALQHSSAIGNKLLVAETHLQIGDIYQEIDRFDDALSQYEKAKDITIEEVLKEKEIDAINRIGLIELKRLNYGISKRLFLHANRTSRAYDYFVGEIHSAVHMVDYYFECQSYNKASVLIEHYIPRCDEKLHHRSLGQLYHRKATFLYFDGKYFDAKECYEKAIDIMKDFGNEDIMSLCLNYLGAVEMEYLGEYKKALDYFLLAEELNIRNNIFTNLSIFKVNIGAANFKLGRYDKALDNFEKAMTIASESNDKRDFFSISKEVIRDYVIYGYYDKAYSLLKKLEIDYSTVMSAAKYLDQHAFMNIQYFLAIENYEVAYKWYQKYKEHENPLKQRGFVVKLLETIFDENHLHACEDITESLLWRLSQLKETAITILDFQLLRAFTLRIAKKLLTSTDYILLRKFIDFDKSLVEYFDCTFLQIQHQVMESFFCEDRVTICENILNRYPDDAYNYSKWICHKLLGDEYHQIGNYYEAMSHYTTALDMVKNITSSLPEEYKRSYIIKDSLKLQLKTRILELYGKILHGRSIDSMLMIEAEINSVDEFFDISELNALFTNNRFTQDVYESLFEKDYPKVMALEDILGGIAHGDETNLISILTYYVQILCADYGRIVFRDDNNAIHKLFEIGQPASEDIEMVKTNLYYENEGLYVNANEESLYTYLLQEGRKAILYIPIFEKISHKDKDDFDDVLYENEIGYIYLESQNVLNNFNHENLQQCRLMMSLVKAFLENYRLRILSTVDKLTGVYLRKHTEERFNNALIDARSNNSELAVIMCDIDKFKHVNDTYGHRKGDEILKSIGAILSETLEDKGFVGRYGGEEFLIILPETSISDAYKISERIRTHIQQQIRVEARKPVTMSLGISCYPAHGLSEEELVENADKALYYSKNTGRNQSTIWSKEISSDQYRFDRLAGILTGNSAVDATNMQSIVEIIGMLKLKLDKNGKLLKVLENLIDITKGETAYIIERLEDTDFEVYMKERGSNKLNLDYQPDIKLLQRFYDTKAGDYFVNWDYVSQDVEHNSMPNWKSIIVCPLFEGEQSKGLVVVEVPIVEREFDFNNYNYVNLMSGLISAII